MWFVRRSNEEEWQRILEIVEKLRDPRGHRFFIDKDYTKQDLRVDLLATVPLWVRRRKR